MVGASSLLGSSVVDSARTCPCLCLDTISLSSMNLKSGGDVRFSRKSLGKRQYSQIGSLELSNSFVGSGKHLLRVVNRGLRMQRKVHRSMIVNELGGQYEDTFKDVKTQLLNYFTYKAVRTVLNQLYEKNPPQHTWLYNFVATNEPGDGKLFIRNLGKEKHDLAERVMATRLHLYGKWVKKCNHAEIYQAMSDENLELMRERLMETVMWPSDDTNTEKLPRDLESSHGTHKQKKEGENHNRINKKNNSNQNRKNSSSNRRNISNKEDCNKEYIQEVDESGRTEKLFIEDFG